MFHGLSAFPLTPADRDGVVDAEALGALVDGLAASGVDSIGLLGSTGSYAYLERSERRRAVAAAVEAAAARVPVIVGVGALRTSWAQALAMDAEQAGADGLLLAPMSYTALTEAEVEEHYRAVASATGLPLCIYNNPGTTAFSFSHGLIGRLSLVPKVDAIKMPLPAGGDVASEIAQVRQVASARLAVGYSGDWGGGSSLLAGGAAWYSVVAGLLPLPALRLTRAAQTGDRDEVSDWDAEFGPIWALFRAHGSLRVMYSIADVLSLQVGDPPLPIQRLPSEGLGDIEGALARLSGRAQR